MKSGRPTQARNRPASRGRLSGFNASHLLFFLGGVVVMGLALLFVPGQRPAAPLDVPPPQSKVAGQQPPWGHLEYLNITLERPDDSFPDATVPVPPTTWFFGRHTQPEVRAVLSAGDLTRDQQRMLIESSKWTSLSNGWLLVPPAGVVRTLAPEARKRIYGVLRNYPENPMHCNPAHFAVAEFEPWLADCGLPEDKQALFRSLTWVEEGQVWFVDYEVMESQCTLAERRRLAKAIAQSPSLFLKLHIGPETDVDALVRYWGRGGRGQAMKPFLESLKRVEGGTSISVSFLFPTFARARLFTYPDFRSDRLASREDCFWTAMNFFNETPDNRFLDGRFIQEALQTQYQPVATNWAFGDVLMVTSGDGEAVHMCVYVADDVVFTKNGLDDLEPWRLTKLADMLAMYKKDQAARLIAFRRKDV